MIKDALRRAYHAIFPARILRGEIESLRTRLNEIERRTIGRNWMRFFAVDETTEYLIGAQVPGDYAEFGVWQGTTFAHACRMLGTCFPKMRFLAFDSFEGLPDPTGLDADRGYSSAFKQGDFRCGTDSFLANIKAQGADLTRVSTYAGWYDRSLKSGEPADREVGPIAAAFIDCDFYESTVPVLNFLTSRISDGSVILFDDWRCFRNRPDRGQQRACREWLERNPKWEVRPLFEFGWNGMAFTVNLREGADGR